MGLNVLAEPAHPFFVFGHFAFTVTFISNTCASLLYINTISCVQISESQTYKVIDLGFQELGHNNLSWKLELDGMKWKIQIIVKITMKSREPGKIKTTKRRNSSEDPV